MRPAFTVDGMLVDGEEIVGIRGHARGGRTLTERARLVVGWTGGAHWWHVPWRRPRTAPARH